MRDGAVVGPGGRAPEPAGATTVTIGTEAYLADDLLQGAGDSLMMLARPRTGCPGPRGLSKWEDFDTCAVPRALHSPLSSCGWLCVGNL